MGDFDLRISSGKRSPNARLAETVRATEGYGAGAVAAGVVVGIRVSQGDRAPLPIR
jgi:hypothetical protein